jgi:hypothetical protein
MKQKPFTAAQLSRLTRNGADPDKDHAPVVKFFCPWGAATWLISELAPDGDTMFGLCDLGHGSAELGSVSLRELRSLRGPWGLTIERDLHFAGTKPLSTYAEDARIAGRITA